MNVGVIGLGVMGKNHVRIYSELKKVDELYIFDLDSSRINSVLEKYDASPCSSIEEMLKEVDAISLCVPTSLHYQIAKKIIRRKVDCLIEKPITANYDEGIKLLELLSQYKYVVVGIGHIERFNPVITEVNNILSSPYLIEIKRHNPSSKRITDVSVIEDLMIHDVDVLFNVFFSPSEYKLISRGNNDVCKALVEIDKTVAVLSASRVSLKKIRSIYVEDEIATIDGDLMNQEIFVYRTPKLRDKGSGGYVQENIIEKVLVNKVEPLRRELKTFIDCVSKGEQFPVTPEQAVRNLKICEEIRRQIS